MALLWIEGFEQYAVATDVQRAVPGGDATFPDIATGRDDRGNALDLDISGANYKMPITTGVNSTFTVGFAFRFNSTSQQDIVGIIQGDAYSCYLQKSSGGEITLERGFTEVDTSTGLGLQVDTWYYIEWEIFVHNTLGTYEVKVDGVSVMSGTNTDTNNNSTSRPAIPTGMYLIGTSSASEHLYDDVYLIDDTGLTNNSFLGDCYVETLFPNGDGTTNDFTPLSGLTNYEMVDDGGTPDNGTTYVSSSTVNHIDLYTFEDLVEEVTSIYGVKAGAMNAVAQPGPRQVRLLTRTGGTNYEGDAYPCSASYSHSWHLWENNPNTAAAWTESNFNSAEFGFTIEA